jgi:hypothetical protein
VIDSGDALTDIADRIARFTGGNLASTISGLEFKFLNLDKQSIELQLKESAIEQGLVDSALRLKRAAAQIDVVIHALGILVRLPTVLEEGEKVESLSLGAGSSETKRFDLETDRRIAEFTFITWQGNDDTRLQKVFKDFYRLAEHQTHKRKELWLTDDTYVLKYFRSKTKVRSATHKHRDVWESFQAKYPNLINVQDYYRLHGDGIVLRTFAP